MRVPDVVPDLDGLLTFGRDAGGDDDAGRWCTPRVGGQFVELGAGQRADVGVAGEAGAYRLADHFYGPEVVLVIAPVGGGGVRVARDPDWNPKW